MEPIKKGVEVTSLAGKIVFEVAKPYLKRRMAKSTAEFFDLMSRGK